MSQIVGIATAATTRGAATADGGNTGTDDGTSGGTYTGLLDKTFTIDITAAYIASVVGSDTFTGSGLDDLTPSGTFTGAVDMAYEVEIDTTATPDKYKYSRDTVPISAVVPITGAAQTLDNGVQITFGATTGHTMADKWNFSASAAIADVFRWKKGSGSWTTGVSCDTSAVTLSDGVTILWTALDNHDVGDQWTVACLAGDLTLDISGVQAGLVYYLTIDDNIHKVWLKRVRYDTDDGVMTCTFVDAASVVYTYTSEADNIFTATGTAKSDITTEVGTDLDARIVTIGGETEPGGDPEYS